MKPLKNTYLNDLDIETKGLLQVSSQTPCKYINHFQLKPGALTPDGSAYFPLVKAYKGKWGKLTDVLRFGVITNTVGITVTIRLSKQEKDMSDLIYRRYRSALLELKNRPVYVTFPVIEINWSSRCGLYFTSTDFKLKPEKEPPKPALYI